MIEPRFFLSEMQQLCHAFGKKLDVEMVWQYYRALGYLTDTQLTQLFHWAKENVETGFPKIATLKKYASSQGWHRVIPRDPKRNQLVYLDCPGCGASSVMTRHDLEKAARANRSFRCINHDLGHCPVVFSARELLEREGPWHDR